MAMIVENAIQEELSRKEQAGEFDHDDRPPLPRTHGLRRFESAWAWPLDYQELRTLPDFPDNVQELPAGEPIGGPSAGKILWQVFRWLTGILVIIFAACVLANTWRYTHTPGPAILQGWSEDCPPDWLYRGKPDMILLGFERRFNDIIPSWHVLRKAEKRFRRCWSGDRNRLHQDNRLGIAFPQAGSETLGDANAQILHRYKQALKDFDKEEFPYELPFMYRVDKNLVPKDKLPAVGSACHEQCTLRKALKSFLRVVLDPRANMTAGYPQTLDELPFYCPCSLTVAWRNLRQTFAHLPQPRSIHPFYTDRSSSSLYRTEDLYSRLVRFYGNEFFVPWRRTNFTQLSNDEMRTLYVDGFWNTSMNKDWIKGSLWGKKLRDARGVGLSKAQKERIDRICEYRGPSCVEGWMNS